MSQIAIVSAGRRSVFLTFDEILEAAKKTHDLPEDATVFDGETNGSGLWLELNSDEWGPLTQSEWARGDYQIKPRT